MGRGNTPRICAGAIATAAEASPIPSSFCAIKPPNECPTTIGLESSARMTVAKCATAASIPTLATRSGCALDSATVAESPGQPGAIASYPASRNRATQLLQESGCIHRP